MNDPLIDRLVADLQPVAVVSRWRDIGLLAGLGVAELALVAMAKGIRPDMPYAMHDMGFWWKLLGLTALFVLAMVALVRGLNPAGRLPGFGMGLAGLVVALLLGGWLIDAGSHGDLAARLMPAEGLGCVMETLAGGLPMLVLTAWLARRRAPTHLAATGLAGGLAAAAAGGLAFVLSCPHHDPLYVAVWYGGAMLVLALVGRLWLARLLRW